MKNFWSAAALLVIPLTLALPACSKGGAPGKTTSPSTAAAPAEALAVLSQTERHRDYTVLDAAATLVRSGFSLPSAAALRCWQGEKKSRRTQVQEACVLAWSTGEDPSTELEAALRDELKGEPSRNLALAMARRRDFAASLDFGELAQLLRALSGEPAWLRLLAANSWLGSNTLPALGERMLWALVALPHDSPDPASLGGAYLLARRLGLPEAGLLHAGHCAATVKGVASSRCLRFLSAVAYAAGSAGLPKDLAKELPARHEAEWQFFARDYPERSLILDPFVHN